MQNIQPVTTSPPIVQETAIVVPVDPADSLRQPEVALLADDFGCVPDGRVLEQASIAAGSAILTDHDGTLRATDVGKNIAIPGAVDMVATIARLVDRKDVARASMNAGEQLLTASFNNPDQEGFNPAVHTGHRITVAGAGPGGTTLLTDVVEVRDLTTLRLADSAATTVTDAKAILNAPTPVALSDYARRTVEGLTIDLGDRSITDLSMTVGASGLASKTAKFSSLDLGKTVTIRAAGLLLTTIRSFELPTQVTLATPADRAVERGAADVWKTDSRPGLEQLLASLKERDVEATEIRFGPGVYDFTRGPNPGQPGALALRGLRNLTLRGSGPGATVLRLMPHQDLGKPDTHVIETRDCRNLTLRDLSVHGAYLTMGKVNEQMHGIHVNEGSEEIVVERVRVFQTAGDGIRFLGRPDHKVRRIWVDGCRFIQNKRTGVAFQRSAEQVWIRNCYIEMTPPSTDSCLDFEPSKFGDEAVAPAEIVIDSNIMVHGNGAVAVAISGVSGDDRALRVKFSNNIILNGEVFCTDVEQLTVHNNVVVTDSGTARPRVPLQVQRGGDSVLITGNIVISESATTEAVIRLSEVNQRPVTRSMVMGNLCFARSGTGIQLLSSADVSVEANTVVATGPGTQGIFVRATSSDVDNISIRNNDITTKDRGSWISGIGFGAAPHAIHHVSVVGNSVKGATNGVQFGGEGFRETPVCALNRIDVGVKTPLAGLESLPQDMMVVGGAANRGGSIPGSGTGRSLIGHGSPEGKVAGNAGDIYQRLDTQAGSRLFVKESDQQPTTGWIAK